MAQTLSFNGRRRVRKVYGKIPEVAEMPNLIEVQKASYDQFLMVDEPVGGRSDEGLQAVFESVFPISDFSGSAMLEFVSYEFEPPKFDTEECRQRDLTYSAPLKVTLRLIVFDIDEDTGVKSIKATHEFNLENVPFKGKADAKVVLVEFADFGCGHCRQASVVMEKVVEKYGDKIGFYYMQFPLREQTAVLSLAALAAHEQGKFWPMHDLLFKNQSSITMEKVSGFAKELGMNGEKFQKDLFSDSLKAEVQRQRAVGEKAEISGTPALFVNGKQFLGEKTIETLSEAIDAQLAAEPEDKTEIGRAHV